MEMQYIDSHSHLYLDAFEDDLEEVMQNARNNGVAKIFLPNIDSSSIEGLHRLCKEYEDLCFPMMGLHPTSVKENFKEELQIIEKELFSNTYIAVGEIGIDLYWDKTYLKAQQDAFRTQLSWAKELALPIVIHARDSFDEIFEIMDEEADESLRGVFHSFTGNKQQAEKILSYDFYIGINGIVTFKNSGLSAVVKDLPLEKLLIETDSPFLAPVPHRGKRNESAYVVHVAEKIAELQGRSLQDIAKVSGENANKLFV